MSILENAIETKVTIYARERGCLALKLNVLGFRGWPDRLYIYHGPMVMFIEFKRLGEKPRKLQEYIHATLRKYGCRVEVVDNERDGCSAIDDFTKGDSNL